MVEDYNVKDKILPSLLDLISNGHFQTVETNGLPIVLLASAGFNNYGHVMTDIIPKLLNVQRAGMGEIILALPQAMATVQWAHPDGRRATRDTCPGRAMAEGCSLPPGQRYLHGADQQAQHDEVADILVVRDIMVGAYGAKRQPSVKLFVARRDDEGRGITNQAEVDAIVGEFGFETVYPANLPIPDQVRLFARASHVIGGLGAGLVNIMYAPDLAKVMMIDPGIADFYFWDLASLLGQKFTWVFANEISGWNEKRAKEAFNLDLVLLRAALRGF